MAEQQSVTVITKGNSLVSGTLASKTFWLNAISFLVLIAEAQGVLDIIPATWMPYVSAGVVIANIALRFWTAVPITGSPGAKKASS